MKAAGEPSMAEGTGLDPIYAWNPKVATRTLEGTAFVLLEGRMISLNAVGTRIWELCKSGASLPSIVASIIAEFDTVEEIARRDAEAFLAALTERGMLLRRLPAGP